ncbi:hypothetical protein IWX90DRAFT_96275 [Phyllosticta citrichinensis]|uniref:Uncharacterized protein n=1 Tax=Phyllosticta citrichinensis TaxID=1130410 RepID=A0ABR1XEW8_9PEZI
MNDTICDCRTDHRTGGQPTTQPAKPADETERDGRAWAPPPQAHHQSRAHESRGTVLEVRGLTACCVLFCTGTAAGVQETTATRYILDSTTRLGRRHAIARRLETCATTTRELRSLVHLLCPLERELRPTTVDGILCIPVSTITHPPKHKSAYIGTYPGQVQPAQTSRQADKKEKSVFLYLTLHGWINLVRVSVSTKCLSVCRKTQDEYSALLSVARHNTVLRLLSKRKKQKPPSLINAACVSGALNMRSLARSPAASHMHTHLPPLLPDKRLIPYARKRWYKGGGCKSAHKKKRTVKQDKEEKHTQKYPRLVRPV